MKRICLLLLALATVSSSARIAPDPENEGSTSSTTFKEPKWQPVQNSTHYSPKRKTAVMGPLEYRIEVIALEKNAHGTPVTRIDLRNCMPTERSFELAFNPGGCASISRPVTLPPNGTATLSFPTLGDNTPYSSIHFGKVTLRETTPNTDQTQQYLSGGYYRIERSYSSNSTPNLLMASALSPEKFTKSLNEYTLDPKVVPGSKGKTSRKMKSGFSSNILRFPRAAKDWPSDYRIYTTFDAVIVTPALHAAFPPEVRQALDDYERWGGAVLVTPDNSESGGLTTLEVQQRFVNTITAAKERLTPHVANLDELLNSVPLTLNTTSPTPFLVPIMILFALVFVPTAYILNAKRNRRLRALVVIPAGAVALALAIGAFSFLFYGRTPTERLQSITFLDQRAQRALTRGQFAVFAPSSVDLGFPLDSTFCRRGTSYKDSGNASVEIGDVYRLRSNWVEPLTSTFFDFERITHRSEKLDIKPLGTNGVQVANLLGNRISGGRLQYGPHTYDLGVLMPGETKRLQPLPPRSVPTPEVFRLSFCGAKTNYGYCWPELREALQLNKMSKYDQVTPPPSTYFAWVDGSPFFPSPLGKRKSHCTRESFVIGTFAEASK